MSRPFADMSHSSMSRLDCAFSYQQSVINQWPELVNPNAGLGSDLHTVCEKYVAALNRMQRPRAYNVFGKILLDTVEGKPEEYQADAEWIGDTFASNFEWDKKADAHITERRLCFNRGLELLDARPWINPATDRIDARLLPCDVISGKPDLVQVYKGGAKARIWDYKTGFLIATHGKARLNLQGRFYAALWFWANPECEEIEFRLWGLRWGRGNMSTHVWTRETACTNAQERVDKAFAKLDALWELLPEGDWPAQPFPTVCVYCPVVDRCPKNLAIVEEALNTRRNAA